jgi:hypothetical protein
MFNFLKNSLVEFITLGVLIFSLIFFIGVAETNINADGIGYYDYLPSTFIHHDLIRKEHSQFISDGTYDRINGYTQYVNYHQYKVNKYPVGVSVLLFPFFTLAYFIESSAGDINLTGYEFWFQKMSLVGSLFYLLLSLIFLRKILETYNLKRSTIIITILLAGLSSNVIHYVNQEATFSHVFSLFEITLFIYAFRKLHLSRQNRYLILSSVSLALIFLTRQINILIVLSIPFLCQGYDQLKNTLKDLFKNRKQIMIAILLFLTLVFLQFLVWFLQTGSWYVDAYGNEGFFFKSPQMFNILFSYKKGLFVYTPIAFVSVLGLLVLIYKKRYYETLTWLGSFFVITYFLSSWWAWWYSCSYGLRAYIEFLPLFFILFAIAYDDLMSKFRTTVFVISLLTIPVNHIQARQYKNFILHWESMDEAKYWNVFLSNSNRFIGLNWKKYFNLYDYKLIYAEKLKSNVLNPNEFVLIYEKPLNSFNQLNKVKLIKVLSESVFERSQKAELEVDIIDDKNNVVGNWRMPLIHLTEQKFSIKHKGFYYFEPQNLDPGKNYILKIFIQTRNKNLELGGTIVSFRTR